MFRTTSFESLFGLLKSRNCPYFYLCSHVTTVMFRLTDEELVADMVPTTYGVRNTLNLEGITFQYLYIDILNILYILFDDFPTNKPRRWALFLSQINVLLDVKKS